MNRTTASLEQCPIGVMARRHPTRVAIESPERAISYTELDTFIRQVEVGLTARGVENGSVVSTLLRPDWRTPVVFWALIRMGACVVPLNARQPRARLKEQVALARSNFCISDDSAVGLCAVELTWQDLLDPAGDVRNTPRRIPELDLSRPATIIFTSGSTGSGRGVVHRLASHWYSALGSQSCIPVDGETRWLVVLPFYHVGGLSILFRCFLHGGCVVVAGETPLDVALKSWAPTHISLVSTQLHRLLQLNCAGSLADLRHVLVGGSRIPDRLVERAHVAEIPIQKSYGLTEMASQVSTTGRGADRAELSTSGEILPFREVRIAAGGEIGVRGVTLFSGYVGRDGLDSALDAGGWFATGDIGRLDERGRLIVTGRKDTMFVSGGENVYPEEIEDAIMATGLVEQAVVVAIENDEFGHRPVAFLSPLPDESELRHLLKARVAPFKIPDAFLELPASSGLKPDRVLLKAMANKRLA